MAVSDYSKVPGENTSISGINIGEGCPPGNVNDALRQLMADVRAMSETSDSGKAPVNHASAFDTYGVGTGGKYGHVKLSDYSNADKGVEEGTAVTPKALAAARTDLGASIAAAAAAASAADTKAGKGVSDAAAAKAAADAAQSTADGKAPKAHAVNATTYGTGNASLYGHVRLGDHARADRDATAGIAATPKAVQEAVDTLTASIADAQAAADAKAPIGHATAATTYGVGTGGLYGHVKLSDYANADRGVPEGFAATPKALATIAASLGARIDEGSATYGDGWVKLSCGIMACWGVTPSLNVDTASTGTSTARTFGQNFKTGTVPTVTASIAAGGDKWENTRFKVETVSNSGFTLTAIAQGSMAKAVSFNWLAVGVWK